MTLTNGSQKPNLPNEKHNVIRLEDSVDKETDNLLKGAKAGDVEVVKCLLDSDIDVNTTINGLNALHLAAKEGHELIVRLLLSKGIDADATTKKKNTALHIASLAGHVAIVDALVEHGCHVNCQSSSGFTPLYMAAQENHFSVVESLLKKGADQNLSTADGFTPLAVSLQQGHKTIVKLLLENDSKNHIKLPALHVAARKNDTSSASLLLESHTSLEAEMQDQIVNCMAKNGFTPLHIASHYGNVEVAELLIYRRADVNFTAHHGITPLHVASKCGKDNMVRLLLNHNAQIDSKTQDGLTPLHCAARAGREQVIDTLLERGAPITSKTVNGLTALHMTAQYDFDQSAKVILSYKAAIIDEVTRDYLSALHVAAHCGSINVAKLLIERNTDINAKALSGFTPLHIACKKGHFSIAQILIKYGATVDSATESGLTSLHVASYIGALNIISLLLENCADINARTIRGETPLHMATRCNQLDSMQLLLQSNADIDATSDNKQTPLHIATYLGMTECLTFLVQHSASIDAMTKGGCTALHLAAMTGHISSASVLLKHGASITLCTKKGFTPLHVACKYGNIKIVSLLLQRNAAVDYSGRNGLRPLHVAAHYNHPNITLVLLRSGSSPDSPALNGYTPLHIAAKKNHLEIAQLLLEYNVHINLKSNAGFTPLHLACQEGYIDMVELLIIHGAEINVFSNNGLSPLHLCAQENQSKCARKLVKCGAIVDARTESGYSPLHIAAYFGNVRCIRFLIQVGAALEQETKLGHTPIICSVQQGHLEAIKTLLQHGAKLDHYTKDGQSVMDIAESSGHKSIVDEIQSLLEPNEGIPSTPENNVQKVYGYFEPPVPECIRDECPLRDSDEESGDIPMDDKNSTMSMQYVSHDIGRHIRVEDDDLTDCMIVITAENVLKVADQPDTIPSSTLMTLNERHPDIIYHDSEEYKSKSTEIINTSKECELKHKANIMDDHQKFLVSFVVSAKGGRLRGCRHSGVQFIMPPGSAGFPTRITCRFLTEQCTSRSSAQPPIGDGEALASRVLELRPIGYKFLSPILIHIPHFAALHNGEREIVIYRSNNGDKWVEHNPKQGHLTIKQIYEKAGLQKDCIEILEKEKDRTSFISTVDIPRFFAICSRIAQDSVIVDNRGASINSTFVPGALMYIPERALQKPVKISLQAIVVSDEFISQMVYSGQLKLQNDDINNNTVLSIPSFSPIISVEPRRRKFHKPITLTIPLPSGALFSEKRIKRYSILSAKDYAIIENLGLIPSSILPQSDTTVTEINQVYASDLQSIRLMCSISGGSHPARWEDITGHTPLTFQKNSVTFTSTVSARFWLMNIENISACTRIAQTVYKEITLVPVMTTFMIFAKRTDPTRGLLRINCLTDTKEVMSLEIQEHFVLVGQSKGVEVFNDRAIIVLLEEEFKTQKKTKKWIVPFHAFQDNRVDLVVFTHKNEKDWSVCLSFFQNRLQPTNRNISKFDSISLTETNQSSKAVPLCTMLVSLPEFYNQQKLSEIQPQNELLNDLQSDAYKYNKDAEIPCSVSFQSDDSNIRATLSLSEIADSLGDDWHALGFELGFSMSQLQKFKEDNVVSPGLNILQMWLASCGASGKTSIGSYKHTPNGTTLEYVLKRIGREDIVKDCQQQFDQFTTLQEAKQSEDTSMINQISNEDDKIQSSELKMSAPNQEAIQSLADRLVQSFSPRLLSDGLFDANNVSLTTSKNVAS